MNLKIYEAKYDPCRMCNEKQAIWLPLCIDNGKEFVYPVCNNCKDKVPYQTIPVTSVLDEGYFHCPYVPVIRNVPILENTNE